GGRLVPHHVAFPSGTHASSASHARARNLTFVRRHQDAFASTNDRHGSLIVSIAVRGLSWLLRAKEDPMCDYSLHGVASRPAKVDDKLVTTRFSNSFTHGFAAVGQPNVAVCLLPGTELAFEENAICKAAYGFLPARHIC